MVNLILYMQNSYYYNKIYKLPAEYGVLIVMFIICGIWTLCGGPGQAILGLVCEGLGMG